MEKQQKGVASHSKGVISEVFEVLHYVPQFFLFICVLLQSYSLYLRSNLKEGELVGCFLFEPKHLNRLLCKSTQKMTHDLPFFMRLVFCNRYITTLNIELVLLDSK